jgi:uncharacterized protein YndB with AHSA1/START domain
VAISGAGPAHYSIAGDEGEAEQIAARVRDRLGGQAQVFVAVPAPPRQQEPVPHRADGVMGDPCDGSAVNSTRITQHVKASRASVYRALLDAKAVETWMVPTGMTSQVHMFEPREGGSFRISLTYEEPTGTGKTTSHTDTHHGRFVRLVPNEQLVEVVEFETSDPAMRGEMTITITLIDADGGTDVLAVHDGLPPGVSTADNEIGWRLSLAKLAALVEAGE